MCKTCNSCSVVKGFAKNLTGASGVSSRVWLYSMRPLMASNGMFGTDGAQGAHGGGAVHDRHGHVEDDERDVVFMLGECADGFGAIGSREHAIVVILEGHFDDFANGQFVVGDQNQFAVAFLQVGSFGRFFFRWRRRARRDNAF